MGNFTVDQAEGLRRMLGGSRPRLFSIVSTLRGGEKCAILINLCASLSAAGSDVLLLEACAGSHGVSDRLGLPRATLCDVAQGDAEIDEIVVQAEQGFRYARLGNESAFCASAEAKQRLDHAFGQLASRAGIVVIDTEVAENGSLALAAMTQGDIVIQVTPAAASITAAYAAIKRLNAHAGRRPFGILITGANDADAAHVFANISKAASVYLAVSLDFVGSVPADDHLKRAAGLGRTVTDAFPLAGASVAFRRLAQRFAFSNTGHEAIHGN